jgi:hypothetical protein
VTEHPSRRQGAQLGVHGGRGVAGRTACPQSYADGAEGYTDYPTLAKSACRIPGSQRR